MRAVERLPIAIFVIAQSVASQSVTPTFDAATVKLETGRVPGQIFKRQGGPGTSDPGRILYRLPLLQLLAVAWNVEVFRIVGPSWLTGSTDRYTVVATMPPATTHEQFHLMFQNLLLERFKVRLHHEKKMFSGYRLVVAQAGKLKEATPSAPAENEAQPGPPRTKVGDDGFLVLPKGHGSGVALKEGCYHANFQSFTIPDFINARLTSFVSRSTGAASNLHIEDATDLKGAYDFKLKFAGGGGIVQTGEQMAVGAVGPPADTPCGAT